jgi:uncharacterized membrane protein
MGGIAAPLLAGFSITLAALVLTSPQHFRWTSLTLILLTGATVALIAALQLTFRALQFAVSPSEIEQWWPDADESDRKTMLQGEQGAHQCAYNKWANQARHAYNFGILFFLAGFTAALIPQGAVSTGRLIAILSALAGVTVEFCWIANDATQRRSKPKPENT